MLVFVHTSNGLLTIVCFQIGGWGWKPKFPDWGSKPSNQHPFRTTRQINGAIRMATRPKVGGLGSSTPAALRSRCPVSRCSRVVYFHSLCWYSLWEPMVSCCTRLYKCGSRYKTTGFVKVIFQEMHMSNGISTIMRVFCFTRLEYWQFYVQC